MGPHGNWMFVNQRGSGVGIVLIIWCSFGPCRWKYHWYLVLKCRKPESKPSFCASSIVWGRTHDKRNRSPFFCSLNFKNMHFKYASDVLSKNRIRGSSRHAWCAPPPWVGVREFMSFTVRRLRLSITVFCHYSKATPFLSVYPLGWCCVPRQAEAGHFPNSSQIRS